MSEQQEICIYYLYEPAVYEGATKKEKCLIDDNE